MRNGIITTALSAWINSVKTMMTYTKDTVLRTKSTGYAPNVSKTSRRIQFYNRIVFTQCWQVTNK